MLQSYKGEGKNFLQKPMKYELYMKAPHHFTVPSLVKFIFLNSNNNKTHESTLLSQDACKDKF